MEDEYFFVLNSVFGFLNSQAKESTLFPRPRTEKVALVGRRKSQKSPQPPFVKGGRGGIYRECAR
jgi:hypothetical protein